MQAIVTAVPTTTRLMMLSVLLWITGIVSVHFASPFGVFSPGFAPLVLLAALPLAFGCVRLAGRFIEGQAMSLIEAVAFAAFPAALLDGMAFTVAPSFYAQAAADQRAAATWLLWFLGLSLALAVSMSGRIKRQARSIRT
jgi:hypothetical protein